MPHRRLALSVDQAAAAQTPAETLNALQNAVEPVMNVIGAALLTNSRTDLYADGHARTWHSSLPARFPREFRALVAERGADLLAQAALRRPLPFTFTEVMQRFQPVGKDRWIFDLMQDHGIRDGFGCPAGPALIGFWSPRVLQGELALNQLVRMQLEANSSVVGYRLQDLMAKKKPMDEIEQLSPRELAVLRQLASGKRLPEVAEYLSVSVTTARVYLRRVQRKVNAKTPLQAAVRTALRGLI